MRALRLNSWKSRPEIVEVPVPEAGLGQVVIRIGGAGACHSDVHLMSEFEEGQLAWSPPFVLGHENAGWVHEVGAGVRGLATGQPVAVVGAWGCGTCGHCRAGSENYCENTAEAPAPGGGGGLGLDGGMAEYMLVPSDRFLVPLPDGLDPVRAAPLTDAGLTPYHAIRRSLHKLLPDTTAVVVGAGGLGHLGVQLLKAVCPARVVVVDPTAIARRQAEAYGADLTLAPGEDTAAAIRAATPGGRGADVVLDFVGSDQTLATAAAAVRQTGDLTIVGIGGGTLPLSFFSVAYEASVQTTYWGTRAELVEVLDLSARGLINPEIETFSLDEAATAYDRLRAGDIAGRAVVVLSGTAGG
jgi:propanol-preferring alcohol dehydrogenase